MRHELTDAGWRGRLIGRHLLITLPFVAVLAAFPGALWIHIAVPALFLICSVGIVALYADDIRVSRLRRHGLTPPTTPTWAARRTRWPRPSPRCNPVLRVPACRVRRRAGDADLG